MLSAKRKHNDSRPGLKTLVWRWMTPAHMEHDWLGKGDPWCDNWVCKRCGLQQHWWERKHAKRIHSLENTYYLNDRKLATSLC